MIMRVIEPVNYVLRKTQRSKPFVVHTDKIKRCFGLTPASWLLNTHQANNDGDVKDDPEQLTQAEIPTVQTTGIDQSDYGDTDALLRPAKERVVASTNNETIFPSSGEVQLHPRQRNPPRYLQDFICQM